VSLKETEQSRGNRLSRRNRALPRRIFGAAPREEERVDAVRAVVREEREAPQHLELGQARVLEADGVDDAPEGAAVAVVGDGVGPRLAPQAPGRREGGPAADAVARRAFAVARDAREDHRSALDGAVHG
jgi:hypothetical protein